MRKHALHNASSAKIWLDCGVHIQKKLAAEAAGIDYNPDTEHTLRGSALHYAVELVLRAHLGGPSEERLPYNKIPQHLENCIGDAEERYDHEWTEEDREQAKIAIDATLNLTYQYGTNPIILIEQKVPLLHEPESVGYVDYAVVHREQKVLVCADHKFGRGEVEPDGPQNFIYLLGLLKLLKEKLDFVPDRIVVGIIQPRLYRDARLAEVTPQALQGFSIDLSRVVDEHKSGIYKGATSLATCDAFCPFIDGCEARDELIKSTFDTVDAAIENPKGLTPAGVEHIVKSAAAIEKLLKELKQRVVGDPSTFPNWTRREVPNARKWSDVLDPGEIAHQLRLAGCEEVYRLDTVAALRDRYPDAAEKIDELSIDQGHHVRLKYGAPKNVEVPVEDEPKRPAARKVRAAPKKSAAKKAAKKPAKKKAAKKRAAKKKAAKRK